MSVLKSDEKLFIFQSLISPSKIVLFEKKYQAFPGVQFNSLPMDDLTAALYYLNAWNRLQVKLTSKFVKYSAEPVSFFQLSSQCFI